MAIVFVDEHVDVNFCHLGLRHLNLERFCVRWAAKNGQLPLGPDLRPLEMLSATKGRGISKGFSRRWRS